MIVERANGEINVKSNLPLKLMLLHMEYNLGILNIADPHQLGAIQILGQAVLQHADDILRALHENVHQQSSHHHHHHCRHHHIVT